MNLDQVHRGITKHKRRKRLGRGTGSGHGKTAGRGHKGQGSRSGYSMPAIFQGGTMPLIRRIPKRGFNNQFGQTVYAVNVGALDDAYENGDAVNEESLREKRIVGRRFDLLKILGDGELSKKLHVKAHRFSASAKEKIEQAGGTVELIPGPKPVVKNKMRKRT